MGGNPIETYRRQIERELEAGDATEHTHRPALKTLLETLYPGVTATNEPKRVACGAPDFSLTRKKVPLGHLETKDVGVNLEEMERGKGPHGEQFTRYRDGLPNWILTDYLEFRWYVAGEKRLAARLAEFDLKGKLKPTPQGEEKLAQLLDAFIKQEALTVSTAKDLAQRMAGMTRIVRDLIIRTFEHEVAPPSGRQLGEEPAETPALQRGWLHNWLAAFREVLLPDLDEKQFADMFAQTLAYGLFAAKVHSGAGKAFSREMAAFNLPKTYPFLRKLFSEIAGVDMPETIDWAVDDIVELLKHADLVEILKDFGKGQGKEDPIVHFYETFLAAYDRKMRELRGVYYTPEAVVSYIVRSLDHLLKTRFNRPKGLADENTLILDPACGTGTFLYFVIQQIYQKFAAQKGAWDGYVAQHLLNRVFGFELLMAPYAVAHLKLGMELQETGYSFGSDQRLGIYLTNTLEEAAKRSEKLFAQWISDEANAAAEIKRDLPIMVVMGNPPYSGISANSGKWIDSLMEDYKETVRGEERQIQRLSNDYVKFIRFGQWRLERTGHGILAFITDSGYLDGILFRDMRKVLLDVYSEIFVLNLHGVSVRGPQNIQVADQNVFDIQQGVAIAIFLKEEGKTGRAKVHYADIFGSREHKYRILSETTIADTSWHELLPRPPSCYFVPVGSDIDYESWPSFTHIIGSGNPKEDRDIRYGTGIKTRHDEFVIGWSPEDAVRRVKQIADRSETDEQLIQELKLCTTAHFDIGRARERARDADLLSYVLPIAYRPFDQRHLVYLREFVCEPKLETMRHLLHSDNIAIGVLRRDRKELGAGFFAAAGLIAKDMVSNLDDALVWPLYVYPNRLEKTQGQSELDVNTALRGAGKDGRRPNLNPKFVADLEKRLGLKFVPEGAVLGRGGLGPPETPGARRAPLPNTFGPEDVFHYIYAVFHSPTYRSRYAEFLKIDFPRVPLTSDVNLFRALCEKGAELVALHLVESPRLENPITAYPVKGSNVVEKGFPKYVAPGEPEPVFVEAASRRQKSGEVNSPLQAALPRLKEGRVYINAVAPDGACPDVIGDRRADYGVRELAPALESGGKPPQSKPALAERRYSGQYFEGVPPEVWDFHIGGYQVCEKWLKDRRGRTLSFDDLTHYQKIITALKETIRLMAEIDAAIPKWPIE
jgi:hypothetical protein